MIKSLVDKPYAVISYDTATYKSVNYYLENDENIQAQRIDPDQFLSSPTNDYQYLNLVIKDMELREKLTNTITELGLYRFSYIHDTVVTSGSVIGSGACLFPLTVLYPGVILGTDVLVHSQCALAHDVAVGSGSFISGGVIVAGNAVVGRNCWIGLRATVNDKITIVDNVVIGAGTIVRKSIKTSGTYSSVRGVTRRI